MTPRNAKIFRRILIVLGIVCVFLLGSIIKVPVTRTVFWVLASLTAGLTLGYVLGTGKELKIWKGFKIKIVKDEKKEEKKK